MFHPKFQQLCLLLIILKFEISICDISRINCLMDEYNRKCTIIGLTLTSKNYTFIPVASDPKAVIKFELKNSVVPILTSNICTTFTELNYFTAMEQHIEIVEDYAFNNCTAMIEIVLEMNNIHKLGVGLFSNTKKLQSLRILGGAIVHIDVDLFSNLSELKILLFSANGLKELPVAAMKNLKKLEKLFLYSNDLSDLDAVGLVENLPNLKIISLNDNNFHCDRLIEIIDAFDARKIQIVSHTYERSMKTRDYIPRKIHNIICLTQAQLETEKIKRALAGTLDELKDLPLAKAVNELNDVVTSGFIDSDSNIINLTNTLNETSDNLNKQILNLNGLLQNTSIEFNGSVNDLKADVGMVRQQMEQNTKDISEHLKNLDEAIASLSIKMTNDHSDGNDNNRSNESLSNNIVAVWVCLTILLLINVTIGLIVKKKFINRYGDVPILYYEDRIDRRNPPHQQETFT